MRVVLVIDCDEPREVLDHISVAREQIKKQFKALEKDNKEVDFAVKDANCYGEHKATICFDELDAYDVVIHPDYTY